ncbi:MAG: putative addiction module antidote protein [Chloroflexota bacterium]|nr:putative addiction module antidote protein [Chloroflexota bacterium]
MPKMDFQPWRAEDAAAALNAALATNDLSQFMGALGTIARAKSMRQVAAESGLGRESLYKSLAPTGRPEFATVLRVLPSFGLRLCVTPIEGAQ